MTSLGETILVSIITLSSFFLGFLVFFKDRKKKANLYFLLLSLSIGVFISAAYASEFFPLTNPGLSILLTKVTYIGVTWSMIFIFFFSSFFPKEQKITLKFFWLIPLAGVFLSGAIFFTPFIIENIEIKSWGFDTVYGKHHKIFLGFFFFLFIFTLLNFLKNYKKIKGFQKKQLHYFFLGLGIFLASASFFCILLPLLIGSEKYYYFGNYSAIFFIGFTAYAILAKQLFEIRVILTELLVGVIGILSFIQALLAPTLNGKVFGFSVFCLFCFLGYLLIKATYQEIERREKTEKLYQELKVLDEAKSEFISMASHQLRTFLLTVKGFLSIVLLDGYEKVEGKAKDFLKIFILYFK